MQDAADKASGVRVIVCPLAAEPDEGAALLEQAVTLAGAFGAKLHVVNAYQVPAFIHPDLEATAARAYEADALEARRQRVDALLAAHPDVEIERTVALGPTHQRIRESIEAADADLVVMGTHARGGLERVLLGSVAERVVRTAERPVWTIPIGRDGFHTPPRSILVAHDFSAPSMRGLEVAQQLRVALRAGVTVVHVLAPELDEDAGGTSWFQPEQRTRYREALGRELARDVDEVFGPDAQAIESEIVSGEGASALLGVARRADADLVVAGACGKNAVERFLLGSTTLELLRGSHVPVLTVS